MSNDTLDGQAAEQLRLIAELGTDVASESVDEQRRRFKATVSWISDEHLHRLDATITQQTVSGPNASTVPVRRYEPNNAIPGVGVVYFHGGAWVVGDLETGDRFARSVAGPLGATVISVDYRRAREHMYPAGPDDCVFVAQPTRDDFGEWCAVAADSAGGNLALATASRPAKGVATPSSCCCTPIWTRR
jgi:acetyl esterase/lipase